MRINKLRILGFKSFAEEAELEFPPGLTAIVGPNGCGKSNICDAIRWVLGEQNVRFLRGKEMEDVIFNGTAHRKPLSLAQVTLELTNLGSLPLDFHEIQITRRLYRSGESEYSFNKKPCRLKDITGLFLEWGINKRIYSIIEQGNIDFILTAKPQQRRILIETAAGILKYKEQKRETEQKIEMTKENLLRIKDIQSEVETQMELLEKQALHAKRYQTLCQKSEEKEKRYLMIRYKILRFHFLRANAEYQRSADMEKAIVTRLTNLETDLEGIKLRALEIETEFNKTQKDLWDTEGEKRGLEKRLSALYQEKIHKEENLARLFKEHDLQQQRLSQIKDSKQEVYSGLLKNESELHDMEKRYRETEDERCQSQKQELIIKEKLLGKRKDHGLLNARINTIRNNQSNLKIKAEALTQRITEGKKEQKELTAEEEKLAANTSRINQKTEELLKNIKALNDNRQAIKAKRDQISNIQKDISSLMEKQRDLCAGLHYKQTHLEELEKRMEGYHASILHLFKGPLASQTKTIAQILSTKKEYECALEGLIGNNLQAVLVDSHREALAMIADLKMHSKGKGTFVPAAMTGQKAIKTIGAEIERHPSFIGKMIDFVYCPIEYQGLVSRLIGGAILVADLEGGMDIYKNLPDEGCVIVTHEGDIINPNGIITGGGREASPSLGILARKRELAEVKERVMQEKAKLDSLTKEHDTHNNTLKSLESELERADSEIFRSENRLKDLERESIYLKNEKERVQRRKDKLTLNQKESEKDLKRIEQEVLAEKDKGLDLLKKLQETDNEINGSEAELSGIQRRQQAVNSRHMEEGVALASLKEKIKGLNNEKIKISESINQSEKDMLRIKTETDDVKDKINGIINEIKGIATRMPAYVKNVVDKQKRLEKIKGLINKTREGLFRKEDMIKPTRAELDQIRKRLKMLEVEVAEWRTRLDDLQQTFVFDFPQALPSEDEIPSYEKELEALKRILDRLKTKRQNFGPVNMSAIDEFQRVSERHRFLTSQSQDLQKAIESLRAIIREINLTSKGLFQDTFLKVNKNFNQIFVRLFEGGEAELQLEEGVDILEAGINIVVQPPGKKLQRIDLLSGGEKALSALALIFAVYQLKPSPFCILDEVDAPLDESNIDRFLKLLKEMKEKTQFICITHCKRTMMAVDTLYGVTMDSPGVSRLVSVRLDLKSKSHTAAILEELTYQEIVQ